MSDIPVIAVTGGPCGGKSTFLVRVREWLERYGIYPIIVSETATELIMAGASPSALGPAFQEELFQFSIAREDHYLKMAKKMHGKHVVMLCGRGVLDCAAYMGIGAYRRMITKFGYSQSDLAHRYQLVVHLVTAAEGAEEFYTLSNNIARKETPKEARFLDRETQLAWLGHPHHIIIDNRADFATKMNRALNALSRRLNMPEPTEIERKFVVRNFRIDAIPSGAVPCTIIQDYLTCDGPGERRVRKRTMEGGSVFFYTEKLPTGERGTRVERERHISEDEYNRFLCHEREQTLATIKKTRYNFMHSGKLFELDVFEGVHTGLVVLEVELGSIDEEFELPPNWEVDEVTDDPAFKNRNLANKKA